MATAVCRILLNNRLRKFAGILILRFINEHNILWLPTRQYRNVGSLPTRPLVRISSNALSVSLSPPHGRARPRNTIKSINIHRPTHEREYLTLIGINIHPHGCMLKLMQEFVTQSHILEPSTIYFQLV